MKFPGRRSAGLLAIVVMLALVGLTIGVLGFAVWDDGDRLLGGALIVIGIGVGFVNYELAEPWRRPLDSNHDKSPDT